MFTAHRSVRPGDKCYYLLEVSANSSADCFLDDWTQDQSETPNSGLRKWHLCTTHSIVAAIAKFACLLGCRGDVAALLYVAAQTKKQEGDRPDSDRPLNP